MSRPRFYDGQPVVCTWSSDRWLPPASSETPLPVCGKKYHVVFSIVHPIAADRVYVGLREFAARFTYWQDGFAPITDEQVSWIIATGLDVPQELYEELADEIAEDVDRRVTETTP